jgi:hypothetical protein
MLPKLLCRLFDAPDSEIVYWEPDPNSAGANNELAFILLGVAVLVIVSAAVAILVAVIVKNRKKTIQAIQEMKATQASTKSPDAP